jgi:hypothetical protein
MASSNPFLETTMTTTTTAATMTGQNSANSPSSSLTAAIQIQLQQLVDQQEITPKTKNEIIEIMGRVGSGAASNEVSRQVANVFNQAQVGTLNAGHVQQAGFFDDVFGTVKKAAKAAVNLASSPQGQQVLKAVGHIITNSISGQTVSAMSVEGPAAHSAASLSPSSPAAAAAAASASKLSILRNHLQQMVAQQELTPHDASKMMNAMSRISSGQVSKEVARQAMNTIALAQSGDLSTGHVQQAGFFDDVFGTVKSVASTAMKIATSPEGQQVLQTAGQVISAAAPMLLAAI